jgi:hypothetical protein
MRKILVISIALALLLTGCSSSRPKQYDPVKLIEYRQCLAMENPFGGASSFQGRLKDCKAYRPQPTK